MKEDFFYSILYRILIRKHNYRNAKGILSKLWRFFWNYSVKKYKGPVRLKLHGESILINNGNPYPLFFYSYQYYNHPLIEIVYQIQKSENRSIVMVDIGSAMGDTMLLLFQTCKGMIGSYYCIEGDCEFHEYLKYNLRNYQNGKIIRALLTDNENSEEKSLLRTHPGTASSQGSLAETALPLDEIIGREDLSHIDLVKIDVDGLDGKILSGSRKMLDKYRPHIIFELHPKLYQLTKNPTVKPFEILIEYGYTNYLFFDKLGNFSHFHKNINVSEIDFLTDLCLREKHGFDWHFDVIAIPDSSPINIVELAEMEFSKRI